VRCAHHQAARLRRRATVLGARRRCRPRYPMRLLCVSSNSLTRSCGPSSECSRRIATTLFFEYVASGLRGHSYICIRALTDSREGSLQHVGVTGIRGYHVRLLCTLERFHPAQLRIEYREGCIGRIAASS